MSSSRSLIYVEMVILLNGQVKGFKVSCQTPEQVHFFSFAASASLASLAAFMTFSRVRAFERSPLTLIWPVMKAVAGESSPR